MEVEGQATPIVQEVDNNSLSPTYPVFPPLPSSVSSDSNSEEVSEDDDTDDYDDGVMSPYHQEVITRFVVQLIQEKRAKRQRKIFPDWYNPKWNEELSSVIQLMPKFEFDIENQDLAKEVGAFKKHVHRVIKQVMPPPEAHNQVALALLDEPVKQLITSLGQDIMDNMGLPTWEAIMALVDALILAQDQNTIFKKNSKSKSN